MIVKQYHRNIKPKNARIPDVATRTLENLAVSIKQQYVNSLYVNGVDCVLYTRKESGRECSCRDTLIAPVLDEYGALGAGKLDELLSDTEVVLRDAGGRSGQTEVEKHAWGPEDSLVFEIELEPITSEPHNDTVEETPQDENVSILPAGSPNCTVCFGTGFAGGYDVHKSYREVLDVTNNPDSDDFYLDHTENPHRLYTHTAGSIITFNVTLPKGAISVQEFRVLDNKEVIPQAHYAIEILTESNTWEEITKANLLNYCTGKPTTIRLGTILEQFRFSHIEIQLGLSQELLRIDMPKFDSALSIAIFDGLVGSIFALPPTVGKVNTLSLIRESLYGRLWRVTSVQDWYDHNRNIQGWECMSRLIQPFETINMLPLISGKVKQTGQRLSSLNRYNPHKFL